MGEVALGSNCSVGVLERYKNISLGDFASFHHSFIQKKKKTTFTEVYLLMYSCDLYSANSGL